MKFSAILLLVVLELFLASCASDSIRMTDAETTKLVNDNPTLMSMLKANSDPMSKYHHSYVQCDPGTRSVNKEQCNYVKCIGLANPPKCWKMPLTDEQTTRIKNEREKFSTPEERAELLKTCQASPSKYDDREKKQQEACYYFLKTVNITPLLRKDFIDFTAAKSVFCSIKNSFCRVNGKMFGNAGYNEFPRNAIVTSLDINWLAQPFEKLEFGFYK